MDNAPLFEAYNLVKCYVPNTPPALAVNLVFPAGKIIGLLGPNGSGKTTLLKMAAGILQPTSGTLRIAGHESGTETKAMVSYLPERNALPNWMTVAEVLSYYEDLFADFDRNRAIEMLDRLQLPAGKRIQTLSKGMKEKVQLVLVMSRRARLYLLDEPIGGVDPATRDYILETILANHSPDSTILISTHLIADIEQVLEEFIFVQHGRLLRYGSVADVHEKEGKTVDALFREVFRC